MARCAWLSVLLASFAVFGLVGCKKKSPTGPDILPPAATTSTVPQVQRLSIAVVAPYIGQTLNTVLEQALTQGLTATGASRWTRNCPSGGTAQVDLPVNYQVQTGNVIILADTDLVLTDCEMETRGATFLETPTLLGRLMNLIIRPVSAQSRARIRARGRPKTRGKWRAPIMSSRGPEYREGEGARVTGSLDVSQVNCGSGTCPSQIGPITMDCNLDGKVCNGSIGGVGVTQGPPDTAPPPNPTTTTTTTTTIPPGTSFSVSPSTLTIGAANWCTGSTTQGTVTVTAPSNVSWRAELGFTNDHPNLAYSINRTSGTGSATVIVTMRAFPIGACVGVRVPGGASNALTFTFSGGQRVVFISADLVSLQ